MAHKSTRMGDKACPNTQHQKTLFSLSLLREILGQPCPTRAMIQSSVLTYQVHNPSQPRMVKVFEYLLGRKTQLDHDPCRTGFPTPF